MRTPTTVILSCLGLLALGLSACSHDAPHAQEPSASAEVEVQGNGEASAEASTEASADASTAARPEGDAEDNRYRADVIVRTGVRIDRNLATACNISDAEAFFAFDSTVLSSRAHDVLARVAECITEGPLHGKELELVGYTDPRGTDEYNKELGLMRAESVAKCLRDDGVALTQIEINSMGEKLASDDASEWPLDRRVDINLKAVR